MAAAPGGPSRSAAHGAVSLSLRTSQLVRAPKELESYLPATPAAPGGLAAGRLAESGATGLAVVTCPEVEP